MNGIDEKRYSRFGALLRSFREQKGLPRKGLAARIGYAGSCTIHALETAQRFSRRPTLPTIIEVAHALNLSKHDLTMLVLASLEDRIEEAGYEFID